MSVICCNSPLSHACTCLTKSTQQEKKAQYVRQLFFQVRNAQLDKEARELRLENESLSENVEYGRAAAVNNEEVL